MQYRPYQHNIDVSTCVDAELKPMHYAPVLHAAFPCSPMTCLQSHDLWDCRLVIMPTNLGTNALQPSFPLGRLQHIDQQGDAPLPHEIVPMQPMLSTCLILICPIMASCRLTALYSCQGHCHHWCQASCPAAPSTAAAAALVPPPCLLHCRRPLHCRPLASPPCCPGSPGSPGGWP